MRIKKKSLEEHKEYIEQFCRVSFFFAGLLKNKVRNKTISEFLRDHTPLFYHALNYLDKETGWNNPDCLQIMKKANELEISSGQEFEEIMYREVRDLAMERAEKFYSTSVGVQVPSDWNVGSLKYDSPSQKLPADYCKFHIANAVAPKSIFDDHEYLPKCFIELMDRSEKEYGYDTLYTETWLNDTPRWLALFPQEWHDNLSPATDNVTWHFGHWGQLVSARGTFNYKAGDYLRENGYLRYNNRSSHCSFQAMRKHLEQILKSNK